MTAPGPDLRAFVRLWAGQTAAALGGRVAGFALTLWLYAETGQATAIALSGLAAGATGVIVNLLAGPVVDRFQRRHVMLAAAAVDAAVTAVFLALLAAGTLEPGHVYAGSAVRGAAAVFQGLALTASAQLMVPRAQLSRAAAMSSFTNYAGSIAGPGLGALLYAVVGAPGALVVHLATFAISVPTVAFAPIPRPPRADVRGALAGRAGRLGSLGAEATAGFRFVTARPGLRAVVAVAAAHALFDGVPNALVGPMILARTGGDAGALAAWGIAAGVGGVASSLLISAHGGPRSDRLRWVFLAMTGAGLAKAAIGLGRGPAAWTVAQSAASTQFPLIWAAAEGVWLAKVPPGVQGRVAAARTIVAQGTFWLGYGLAAPVADRWLEPALRSGDAPWAAWLVGTGPGAGYALLVVLACTGMAAVGLVGLAWPTARNAERLEPDHDAVPGVVEPAPARGAL